VKKGWRVLAIIVALFLICTAIAFFYSRTDHFQEWVRARLVSTIEKTTGLKCKIARAHIDIFSGRIEILNLEMAPTTAAPGLVSIRASSIKARISVSSFWHFRIRLAELEVLRPQVELLSEESAESDSSWNPQGILNALKISFRLEASRAVVLDGIFKINDRSAAFNLSYRDLDCEIRYSKKPSYKIHLEYSQSRIFWEKRDIVHDLELDADISLNGIDIEYIKFRHGATLFTGSGSMKDWASPALFIHVAGKMDARDLTLTTPSLDEGRGDLGVVVDLRYDRNGVYSKGKFSARNGFYRKLAYSNLAGSYEIQRDVMNLEVSGKIGGGGFLLNGDLQLKRSNKEPNRLKVATRNVSLINAGRFLNLPLIDFENAADATTILTWYSGQELKADCDARLYGLNPRPAGLGKTTLLDGNLHFTYFESGAIQISSASLKSPYTTVQASGGQGLLFQVQLHTNRLSEPLSLLAGFSPSIAENIKKYPDLMQMGGDYDFQGNVGIKSSADVEYQGSVQINNGNWRSFQWDYFSTQAHYSAPKLKLQSTVFREGSQIIEGLVDLELLEGEKISSFIFQGKVQNIALASLKDFGIDPQVAGALSGGGSIQYKNGVWSGDGQISVENGYYYGKPFDREPFDRLRIRAQMDNQRLQLKQAEVVRDRTRLSAEGQVDFKSRDLNLSVRLDGYSLGSFPMIREKNTPVQGILSASGALKGTLDNPTVLGGFELKDFCVKSWNFGPGTGRLNFKDGRLQSSAAIKSDFGVFDVLADLSTDNGYPGKISIKFDNLDVQKIFPGKAPSYLQEISTALKGKVDIEGPFAKMDALKINGELDGAHLKVQDYELHNSEQVRFALINNTDFRLESVKIVGEGTSLVLNGVIPLDDSRNLELDLKGLLNLRFLEGVEKKLNMSGGATLDIRANGKMQDPQIIGRATFQDAKLDYQDFPLHLSSMQGDMVFSRNIVRLENIHGTASSGAIKLTGEIEHHNLALRSINMKMSLQNSRLAFPKDFRSVINSELVLNWNKDRKILYGDIDVIRSEYLRRFNLLEQLMSRSVVQSGPLTTSPFLLGLGLDVDIHSNSGLRIDNELTSLRGSLRLKLRGTPAYPFLTGQVEASEGTIFFHGSRFEISHASADFMDRNRINPVLEIRAEANVRTYRLILDVIGDLEHLNLYVTSDPPLSMPDIMSLLTTGKADPLTGTASGTGANSRHESRMTSLSAASVLSENLTGVIGKRVQRIFGFESFRVDPFLAGAENDPTARVTLSERLAKDLVVTFSRNLTTNQEQIVIIEYDVSKDLSVVATRDEDGKYGLDFRFRKRLR
jgi:translocation and assembly module TamB